MSKGLLGEIADTARSAGKGLLNILKTDPELQYTMEELAAYKEDENPLVPHGPMLDYNLEEKNKYRFSFKPEMNDMFYDSIQFVESSDRWDARSSQGAIGLMQIRPQYAIKPGYGAKDVFAVADELGIDVSGMPRDVKAAEELLYNPEVNRAYGVQYLQALYQSFRKSPTLTMIAYNWGPTNARRWLEEGADYSKLPEETFNYLKKVRDEYFRRQQQQWAEEDMRNLGGEPIEPEPS